ncbi:hypothetical protein ACHAXR_005109 [Thalassiosira sp. AJA248-18]
MDKRLVFLVRQTERYGESLQTSGGGGAAAISGGEKKMTIEEALSNSLGRRKAKSSIIDYSRMDRDANYDESSFYGESIIASQHSTRGGAAASKSANAARGGVDDDNEEVDDYYEQPTEVELANEAKEEQVEYAALLELFKDEPTEEVKDEVHKLLQERDMDLEGLIRRLMEEGQVAEGGEEEEETEENNPLIEVIDEAPPAAKAEETCDAGRNVKKRRVCFASSHEEKTFEPSNELADANASASTGKSNNVTNDDRKEAVDAILNEDDYEEKDEFHLQTEELDDETTIDAEENMGRDISYKDEIDLLNRESEMSIEELRAMYANMDEGGAASDDNDGPEKEAPSDDNGVPDDSDTPAEDGDTSKEAALAASLEDDDQDEKDEFHLEREEVDDETTIDVEEKLGRDMSYQEEIDLLNKENEMSVEDLRAMYARMEDEGGSNSAPEENDGLENSEGSIDDALAALDEDDQEEKDEFHLEREELDDETTIDVEEKLGRDMSYQEEIDLLQRESEMSVEELRAMYANMDGEGNTSDNGDEGSENQECDDAIPSLDDDDQDEKDEFHLEREEVDDETTMAAEEKLGRDMSFKEEIDLLNRESEMSVEELRAMYATMDDESSEDQDFNTADPAAHDAEEDGTKVAPQEESSKRKHSSVAESDVDDSKSPKKTKSDTNEGISALESLAASDTKARETMITRPFLLASWVKLRAYQHIGLNWLVSIQSRRLNGILADEMGLGKTLQTISMLAYLASYKGIWGPHLIIVPTSCLVNWEVEFKRFCPGLKVMCYYGNAKRRKELRTGWTKSNVHHVVITSYQLAVQDAFAFKRKKWYYLILDEAHNIKK